MTSRETRVIFAGGGTGGHLYPGLAIARALVKQGSWIRPFFIGAQRGIETEILPTTEFPFALLNLHPLYRRAPLKNWRTIVGAASAWRAITTLSRAQRPAAVIGTGGYAAAVALAWARAHRIPTMLHEPDSHPGLTTRAFSSRASAIFLGFAEAADSIKIGANSAVFPMGCPITPPPVPLPSRADARRAWDLPSEAFVVLVTGGSQGARALNETVMAWCRNGLPDTVALIWGTGRNQFAAYRDRESRGVRVRPYLAPIADAYAAADLAVTRAGAMTIAELCAWGIPSILVPLPTAAQDHQTWNAKAVVAHGAAIHVPQRELSAEHLDALVRELIARPEHIAAMHQAALRRGQPDAAFNIATTMLKLLSQQDGMHR